MKTASDKVEAIAYKLYVDYCDEIEKIYSRKCLRRTKEKAAKKCVAIYVAKRSVLLDVKRSLGEDR